MRRHRLEVGDERHVGARAHEVSEVSRRGDDGFLPQRAPHADVALWSRYRRGAREHLAALAPDEVREHHVDPVLVGNVPRQALPAPDARRRRPVPVRPGSAGRRCGRDEDDLRPVERRDTRRHAVPRVLADEQRSAPPRRVERAHLPPALDEALLVEEAVRRQEDLAMHVSHDRLAAAERHVHRRVVERVAPDLVEPDHDVERSWTLHRPAIGSVEVARERPGGHSLISDAPLEEVPGERRLRQAEHRRPRVEGVHLGEEGSDPREVAAVIGLARPELRNRQVNERWHRDQR
jgi:hypothetical protein